MRRAHVTNPSSVEEKIDRYLRFWRRRPADRPLVGFSVGGWFPLQSYRAMQKLRGKPALVPDDLHAEEFLDDYQGVAALWDGVEDDMIRGLAPIPPFPWLEAMLGCRVQIGAESIWAEEGGFEYADLPRVDFSDDNPWRRKYLEFVETLREHFADRIPVGQPILRGPSDMIAAMRGSSEMIFDFYDNPEGFRRLAERCTDFAIGLVRSQQAITGPFAGGYLIEQLGIWAPDRLARLQEDSSALFSPDLYTTLLQPWDRRMAEAFPYAAIHLHSSSLFLLDRILDIESLGCIQINKDVGNAAIAEMMPFFKMVQARRRSLLIRGKLDAGDLALLRSQLSPDGLYLQIVVETAAETHTLRDFFAPWA
jgi:hypothetical protein